MASISRLGFLCHLRGEPNQYILHYRNGKLVRHGAGLSYWFNPLSAAVAQVPVEDCETTFSLRERSADFQDVHVQVTLTYRFGDPIRAASRVNFSISLKTGAWLDEPLERLDTIWQQQAQEPARRFVAGATLVDALKSGSEVIHAALVEKLQNSPELQQIGLRLVAVQVNRVAPTAELEKALQTPSREAMQQKADEAMFQRRALAVENERAIKENELQTEIELAQRQEDLIRREGANRLLDVRQQAEAEKEHVEAQVVRKEIAARGYAQHRQIRAQADAAAQRLVDAAQIAGEQERLEVWKGAPSSVYVGLAMQEFAGKIDHIQHLNVTPSLWADALEHLLTGEAEK